MLGATRVGFPLIRRQGRSSGRRRTLQKGQLSATDLSADFAMTASSIAVMGQFKRHEPRQQSRRIDLADDRLDIGETARIRMEGRNVAATNDASPRHFVLREREGVAATQSSVRGAPFGASPESILTMVVMDSGPGPSGHPGTTTTELLFESCLQPRPPKVNLTTC